MNTLCQIDDPAMIPAMAEDPKDMSGDGWERQGITIPKNVWKAMRSLAGKRGHGSMKVITTAGAALIAGMPDAVRDDLLRWITLTDWDHGPDALTPEAVWAELERLLKARSTGNIQPIGRVKPMPVVPVNGPTGEQITHEVTRILDPDILGKGKKKGAA